MKPTRMVTEMLVRPLSFDDGTWPPWPWCDADERPPPPSSLLYCHRAKQCCVVSLVYILRIPTVEPLVMGGDWSKPIYDESKKRHIPTRLPKN